MEKENKTVIELLKEWDLALQEYVSYSYYADSISSEADDILLRRERAEVAFKKAIGELVREATKLGILAKDIVPETDLQDIMWIYLGTLRMLNKPSFERHKIQVETERLYWGGFLEDYALMLSDFVGMFHRCIAPLSQQSKR